MKKILSILSILLFVSMMVIPLNKTFAYSYNNDFKVSFYESFVQGFFKGLKESLLAQGFLDDSVNTYITTLKPKVNFTSLEQASWGCVSKYSVDQMLIGATNNCFEKWINNFLFVENVEFLNILKKIK